MTGTALNGWLPVVSSHQVLLVCWSTHRAVSQSLAVEMTTSPAEISCEASVHQVPSQHQLYHDQRPAAASIYNVQLTLDRDPRPAAASIYNVPLTLDHDPRPAAASIYNVKLTLDRDPRPAATSIYNVPLTLDRDPRPAAASILYTMYT